MNTQKIYFPNLNGLRFIAAYLVIIHHTEQIKLLFKLDSYNYSVPFIQIIGKLGVVLFFVLSGFLITYLLMAEENSFKTIDIKKFYIRRILKIWPLYFLIISLSLFIIPEIKSLALPDINIDFVHKNLIQICLLYLIMLPNLAISLFPAIPYASHTWSIGTEEQFYLIWPLIIKSVKKHRAILMVFVVVFYLGVAKLLSLSITDFLPNKLLFIKYWSSFLIDCMAIGGFYAVLLKQKSKLLKFFLNNYVFYSTLLITSVLLLKGQYIPKIHYEFYAILFGILILNFAANNKIRISLENKVLNYLGTISYGLYMYHPIAIVLSLLLAKSIGYTTNWIIYPLTICITILMAALSFRYFESYFLKFKGKFSKVKSGN